MQNIAHLRNLFSPAFDSRKDSIISLLLTALLFLIGLTHEATVEAIARFVDGWR